MSDCPPGEVFERLLAGRLSAAEAPSVEAHVQECPGCQGLLEELTCAPAGSRRAGLIAAPRPIDEMALDRLIDRRPMLVPGDSAGRERPTAHPGPVSPTRPTVAGFEVIREAGRGGMGVVYEAIELALGRRVALKILPPMAADPTAAARFRREIRAAGGLHHTNIVPIFGAGQDGGLLYYAMQFIDGEGLDGRIERLRRERRGLEAANAIESRRAAATAVGSPSAAAARARAADRGDRPAPSSSATNLAHCRMVARIGRQVANALQYAHDNGFLHRDIKPSNILVDAAGTAWVTDFGLAKGDAAEDALTQTGDIVGTLRYMPPERLDGRSDGRGDVYALGATLYELLTLRPVFDEADRTRLIERVLSNEPLRPRQLDRRVPRDLETIVLKAMAKEPARRYATAGQLADDLGRFLEGETITARRAGTWERSARWARRRPGLAALCGAVLLLAASLLGLGAWSYLRISHALGQADAALGIEARIRAASERLSAELALDRGIALAQDYQVGPGLLWMLRGLELAPPGAHDLRWSARANLSAWLDLANRPKQIIPTGGGFEPMALSPDGATAVTGHRDGTLRSWDLATGRLLASVHAHDGGVLAVKFRPDGRAIGTNGYRASPTARLWDPRSLRPIGRPMPHRVGTRLDQVFRPDGRVLLTFSSDDGMVRSWEAATGQPAGPTIYHPGVLEVVFSPDGARMATAGRGHEARLWDVATAGPVGPPLRHPSLVQKIAFSPDGRLLATIDGDDQEPSRDPTHLGRLRIWEASTGRLAATGPPNRDRLLTFAFHPDGRRIVAAGAGRLIQVLDAETAQPLGAPMNHAEEVHRIAFSPDGRMILTAGTDGTVRLLDVETGQAHGAVMEHGGGVAFAGFVPDGRTIVTASSDDSIRVWDSTGVAPSGRPLPHRLGVQTAEFSPDGRLLATASFDGTARLFEVSTGQPVGPPLLHSARVRAARFRPDGKVLATGGDDNTVRLWDVATGRPVGPPLPHGHWVVNLRFSPDGKRLLAGRLAARAVLWDLSASPPRGTILRHSSRLPGEEVWQVEFTRDGRTAITGDGGGSIGFWDAETGRQLGDFLKLPMAIHQLLFDRAHRHLFALSGGRIHTVDCESRREVATPLGEQILTMALSPDGETLLTGGLENVARRWSAATGRPIGPRMRHHEAVRGVAYSPDGSILATVTTTGHVRFWDAATSKPIGPDLGHPGWLTRFGYDDRQPLAFAPDGRSIITVGGGVVVWPVPGMTGVDDARLTAVVRARAGVQFDPEGDLLRLDATAWGRALKAPSGEPATTFDPLGWHDRNAAHCEQFGPPIAALWHLDRLVAARPDDWSLLARRARVHRQLDDPARAMADEGRSIPLGPPDWVRAWQAHDWLDRAAAALEGADWPEALALLDCLVDAIGPGAGVSQRRGEANARLGRWADAAADLESAVEAGFPLSDYLGWLFHRRLGRGAPDSGRIDLERLMLYHLAAGDLDGYRASCSRLWRRAPRDADPRQDIFLVYLLTLGSGGLADPCETVRLAETAIAGLSEEEVPWAHRYLGAALYRAGRYAEAIARLEAIGQGGEPRACAFLAMAHQRLGHPVEARQWLDRLRAPRPIAGPARFLDGLESTLLRREAEAVVLLDPVFPADPFTRPGDGVFGAHRGSRACAIGNSPDAPAYCIDTRSYN